VALKLSIPLESGYKYNPYFDH